MKLRRLTLTNFRSYEQFAVDFTQPRTLIVGPNGIGKSTILAAIDWALTGRCQGINAKGEGQADLIRAGADGLQVVLETDEVIADRSYTKGGGMAVNLKTEQLLAALGTNAGMLRALLNSSTFFDLHHADAKALLMNALDVTIPRADLPGIDLPGNVAVVDLDYLEGLYKQAFDNRTLVKRQLAAHQIPEKPKVIDMALAGKDPAGMRLELADNQDALQALVTEKGDQDRALQVLQERHDTAALQAADIDKLNGSLVVHQQSLDQHQGELRSAKAAVEEAEADRAEPVADLQASVRETELLIGKLGDHNPDRGCVLSPSIPCLTKAADFQGHVGTLKQHVTGLERRIAAALKRQDGITIATQRVKDADRNVAYHTGQIEDIEQQIAEALEARTSLKGLKTDVAAQKKKAAAAAAAVPKQRELVDHQTTQLMAVTTYQAATAAYQRAKDERADLEEQKDKLEAAVKLLGPTGIRATALGAAMVDFLDQINKALVPFGFAFRIQVDPWQVEVQTNGGHWFRFEMLSKAQRLWTALGFQVALAKVSGVDFLAIDDVEGVVGKNRQQLTGLVMQADTGQVLLAMATPEDYKAPTIPGMQVLQLADVAAVA